MKANRPKLWALLVLVLGGAGAFAATQGAPAEAADHLDPPNRVHSTPVGAPTDDREADIADVFAWTNGAAGASQTTTLVMSFDGPNMPAELSAVPCDPDVLYQIHIDTNGDPTDGTPTFEDEHTINVRFGADADSHCFVEASFASASGVTPIYGGTITGATEHVLARGAVRVQAGLFDDAFFFDLDGFRMLLDTGMLSSFYSLTHPGEQHDSFAGLNTPAIVVEFPTSALGASGAIRVWGSTARHD